MKTVIVYDSLYGNTKAVAQAVAAAVPGEVTVLPVAQARAGELEAADLLIVGSPTHGSLPTAAIQALLQTMGPPAQEGAQAATFDTRLTWPFLERWGFAAEKMAASVQEKGWTLVGTAGGFFVRGLKKGPLKRGELERATLWAKQIAESRT